VLRLILTTVDPRYMDDVLHLTYHEEPLMQVIQILPGFRTRCPARLCADVLHSGLIIRMESSDAILPEFSSMILMSSAQRFDGI
jgi:hypothetical protein